MTGEELDRLPVGSVVLDYYGFAWQKARWIEGHPWRRADGSQRDINVFRDLPERVLWRPKEVSA